MQEALFYPWIDIKDEGWLKTSLLHFDTLRTIVPESLDNPYETKTGRALEEAGVLVPLRVHPSMEEMEGIAEEVIKHLETPEGAVLLGSHGTRPPAQIHLEKLPHTMGRLAQIHPEKLPYELGGILQEIAKPSKDRSGWMDFEPAFADYYMTLLATKLADRIGAGLLTPMPSADRLAVSVRLDAQLHGQIPDRRLWDRFGEYQAFGRRRMMPSQLAAGLLSHFALQQIQVAPDTSVDQILRFRSDHRKELLAFRGRIHALSSAIKPQISTEAMRSHLQEIYEREIVAGLENLKQALIDKRIKWSTEGFLKVSFLSAAPTSALVLAGLSTPLALLAGTILSVVATSIMYNIDKRDIIRNNPYSYLLSLEAL